MKKQLLALAVGAVAVLPVTAFATGPTLYGQIDVSLEFDDNGTSDQYNLVNNSSRLGVRGEAETAIEGLKGLYQAEYGIDATDGTLFTQRDIFVGLEGGFGKLRLGTMDTPFKVAQGKVDQFNDSSLDMGNYVPGELRNQNSIYYTSPTLADSIKVHVALIPGEGLDVDGDGSPDDGLGDVRQVAVTWESGDLYVGYSYADGSVSDSTGADIAGADNIEGNRLAATYTAGDLQFGGLVQIVEDANNSANEDTTFLLSAAYMMESWKFKAQAGQTEGDSTGNKVQSMAIGADYALGKSTTAYGFIGKEEDDAALDRQVIAVGLRQKF